MWGKGDMGRGAEGLLRCPGTSRDSQVRGHWSRDGEGSESVRQAHGQGGEVTSEEAAAPSASRTLKVSCV